MKVFPHNLTDLLKNFFYRSIVESSVNDNNIRRFICDDRSCTNTVLTDECHLSKSGTSTWGHTSCHNLIWWLNLITVLNFKDPFKTKVTKDNGQNWYQQKHRILNQVDYFEYCVEINLLDKRSHCVVLLTSIIHVLTMNTSNVPRLVTKVPSCCLILKSFPGFSTSWGLVSLSPSSSFFAYRM